MSRFLNIDDYKKLNGSYPYHYTRLPTSINADWLDNLKSLNSSAVCAYGMSQKSSGGMTNRQKKDRAQLLVILEWFLILWFPAGDKNLSQYSCI